MAAPFNCNSYYSFLFDRAPHFVDPILRDWFPTDDAWIGHVTNGTWDAFTGTTHVRDRIQVGAPDMSQAWQTFDTSESNFIGVPALGNANLSACTAGACAPTEIAVGWGSTRTTFGRERQSYTTNPLCFDEINTRAKAREQFTEIVKGIKDMTMMIQSDYLRTASLRYIDNLYICSAAAITGLTPSIPVTNAMITGQAAFVDIGGAANLPLSALTIQYLQRFYEPLQNEGYFRDKLVYGGMFKLITDVLTSQQLTNGNPALTHGFKFSDFQTGGTMFKYGVRSAIGNFAIAWDSFPMRFYWDGSRLRRVWPYVNVPATIGVKRQVSIAYVKAPYQISQIWHEASMFRYVPKLEQVNSMMPFMTRDLGGKWQFFGGERDKTLVVTTIDPTTGLPVKTIIDNKRGNQGLLWADFSNAIEMQRPELSRVILHQREPGCVVDAPACSVAPAYVTQSWAANPVCCTI
jgi:hypothetical protein